MWLSVFLLLFATFSKSVAFEIYWNVPSVQCKKVRPDLYNITANKDRRFWGEKFVIFYEPDIGLYPWCDSGPNDATNKCQNPVNGGVPQKLNMAEHLAKVRLDVARAIPNEDYDGLAIIDFERWRPLFDLNWTNRNVYKQYSTKLVMDQYPTLNRNTATYVARFLFDKAAKEFFVKTIETAREVRPKAKWTYWDFPLCNYDVGYGGELECKPEYSILNEQLLWIFNASDIIIPPAYFYKENYSPELRQKHVYAKISQAEEINKKLYPKKLPIYLYVKMEYAVEWNETTGTLINPFYSKADVCNSVKFPYDMGVNGIIIWSTSNYMKKRCESMANFVDNVLGPFSAAVVHKASKCSQKQCNGHGRCAMVDRLPLAKCELAYQPETRCICEEPYTGKHCERQMSAITEPEPSPTTSPMSTIVETSTDGSTEPMTTLETTFATTHSLPSTPTVKKRDCTPPTVTENNATIDSSNSTSIDEDTSNPIYNCD